MNLDKIKNGMIEKIELPRDLVKGFPRIEILGDEEITVENHQGIKSFDKNKIEINSSIGKITLVGEGLEILFMGGETITIGGKFKSIAYREDV
ncbi:sporulation protein YqfC [Inconstantimicrobium mannanitabidum]|uniref:Sporulation protein YqfC n=1 Tax=Inconstantimicrobium mannanitabidum TaxID=1604901 RepID=A0ACB5R978_9CLOT|nr:sporulation protein YqfC [Clostridium sp. TW13]GKX65578.1 sporulation protein YqfC [Clostridium sp. TW13]